MPKQMSRVNFSAMRDVILAAKKQDAFQELIGINQPYNEETDECPLSTCIIVVEKWLNDHKDMEQC